MDQIVDDLIAEHAALDEVLEQVSDWEMATPAEGWSVADTISHLWFFDQRAVLALTDPEAFRTDAETLLAAAAGGADPSVEPGRSMAATELHDAWRRDRAALAELARGVDPATRVPWYGPAMGARSFLTARLMETWAHGQDVADAVGVQRPATARLRHVAHIGVRARPFSYAVRGRATPETEVFVDLEGPDGDRWQWGDPALPDRVTGSALEFCLVVTQRRHLDDTALEVVGEAATEWMAIAQAFAGPPGPGRAPLAG